MDEPSLEALLRQGIAAAKRARQTSASTDADSSKRIHDLSATELEQQKQARELLLRVTELDEHNILAWLWLSVVVDTPAEKQICLENVLILDPDNQHALAGLAQLQQLASTPKPVLQPQPPSRPVRSKYPRLKPPGNSQVQPSVAKKASLEKATPPDQTQGPAPHCPFCQQSISSIDKSCSHCQLPLVMICPRCITAADVEQSACAQCDESMGNYHQPLNYFAELGMAYRANQRHEAAVKAWQAVERLQPDYPHLQLRLGEAHLGLGRPDRAWTSLQRALQQEPNSAEVHFALGELTRQRGEREEAFEHYQTAAKLDPQHGLAWFQLGQILRQARMRQQAVQALRRAANLLPADSVEHRQTLEQLERLTPSLPQKMATGWSELIRQMTGPMTLCVLAALLDSGLRPWWIPFTGWFALMLALSGAFLGVSAGLPRNPLIRLLAGERGLSSSDLRITLALVGALLWLLGLALILLPLGQSYPEPPQL